MDEKNLENKYKPPEEWFVQSEYDLETAEVIFKAGKYIYVVFMCHLSIEKALKGLYAKKFTKDPPKTHDLSYHTKLIELELPESHQNFLDDLNELCVPTRYPDELKNLLKQYRQDKTENVLKQTKVLLLWLKEKL